MKETLKKFFEKLPGGNGKHKKFMAIYYTFFNLLILSTFLSKSNGANTSFMVSMIFLVSPAIVIGIRNRKTLNKREKLNYIVFPVIFIFLLFKINSISEIDNSNNIKKDGLKELGIIEATYNDTIKKYEDLKLELSKNRINESTYTKLNTNYKNLQNSFEVLKGEVSKKQEVYDELLKKKAAKEERERLEREKKEKEEQERKAKEAAEQEAERARIAKEKAQKEAQAKKEASKNNTEANSNKNNGTFKPSDGKASHNHRTGYDSPDSDPNEPTITSDYGYVASGNSYIHKNPNCKFIRGKSTSRVSVSASGRPACNCWYY